jgi:hypothetical protein
VTEAKNFDSIIAAAFVIDKNGAVWIAKRKKVAGRDEKIE